MKIKNFVYTVLIMVIGLVLLKFIPIKAFGGTILFDASLHLTTAIAGLYLFYLCIEEVKSWRIPYFIFALLVLVIISVQKIISNAHDDVGLLLGLLISFVAIFIPRWREVHKKIK